MKREQDPRFRHLETIVGAFLLIALAGIVSAVVFLGTETGLFAETFRLRIRTASGTGLAQGMPVKLSGFRIGRVEKLSLDDQAMVVARLRIDGKYRKWLRADSIATLYKEGLVGDSVLNISPGSQGSPEIPDDGFLPFEEEMGLAELAQEFSEKVDSVLTEVRRTVVYINDPEGDIRQALANIRRLSENLEKTRGHADDLLQTATDSAERFGPVMDNLAASLDNVERRLPVLLDRMEGTLVNAERISLEVRGAAEKAAPRIPPLLHGAEELVEDTDDVVKGVKRMWPFRKHIPPENERGIVPGDSHE